MAPIFPAPVVWIVYLRFVRETMITRLIRFAIAIAVFLLPSCDGGTIENYERLVGSADKMVISRQGHLDTVILSEPDPVLQNMKDILRRNIQPESPRKFIADWSVALFSADQRVGTLALSYGEKRYVNFVSDSLNFTFRLTYGIGMSLGELLPGGSR